MTKVISEYENNPSVIDYSAISGIDCEGDDRETVLVLTYDPGDSCYTLEKLLDGTHQDCESFDVTCLDEAQSVMTEWAKEAEKEYDEAKREYEAGRIKLASEALRELVSDRGDDFDSDSARAIKALADVIQRGFACTAYVFLSKI